MMILMWQGVQIILEEGGNSQCRVVGHIDWEHAGLFPLGTSAWCIRFLSVPIIGSKARIMDKAQPMVEAFWKSELLPSQNILEFDCFYANGPCDHDYVL
jgi:hypothetical protein